MATVYIGLGSNIGDKLSNIIDAAKMISDLEQTSIVNMSTILRTKPVDLLEQPDFLNQIIIISTELNPEDLFLELQHIEIKLGRTKTIKKGPRTIDLDILLYDNLIMCSEMLTIPHPEIKNRQFILNHLVELTEDLKDPITEESYKDLLK